MINKKITFFIGISVLILAIILIGIYFSQKNVVENKFLYRNGQIPQDKLISIDNYGNVDTSQIKGGPCTGCQLSPSYICKDTNNIAEKIEFYSHSAGTKVKGGWSYRYALVCGDNYWILDAADSFGIKVYGPFEK